MQIRCGPIAWNWFYFLQQIPIDLSTVDVCENRHLTKLENKYLNSSYIYKGAPC